MQRGQQPQKSEYSLTSPPFRLHLWRSTSSQVKLRQLVMLHTLLIFPRSQHSAATRTVKSVSSVYRILVQPRTGNHRISDKFKRGSAYSVLLPASNLRGNGFFVCFFMLLIKQCMIILFRIVHQRSFLQKACFLCFAANRIRNFRNYGSCFQ